MSIPRISLVTICYNNVKDIELTIDMVNRQTLADFEYIIVDGGSTDGTLEKIGLICKRPYTLVSEKDKGLYDAINKGLRMANGEYVGLVHAGDMLYDEHVLSDIVTFFHESPSTQIIYGHSLIVKNGSIPVRVNKSPEFSKGLIRRGWMPSHQSIYIKRSLFEKHGYYNLDLHPSSDYEFFIRYFYVNHFNIRRLDRFIIKFSVGGRSTKNYLNNLKAQKQHVACWEVNGLKPPSFLVPFKLLRKPKQFILGYLYRLKNYG